jgi:hypothetical protein
MSSPALLLAERLGLSDDELCAALAAEPLAVISGELDHRPELPILLALTEGPAERLGTPVLRRWLRTKGPSGRPLDLLLDRDFHAFEAAVEVLDRRGFVIRG